jgi:SAM-dependent methyltransferase
MLRLFQMAELKSTDVFYDLGCGDGRVVVEAVKRFGLIGKGVDIDPARIIQSKQRAEKEGVYNKTIFLNESFFDTDFSDATVIFAFLNNTLNRKLRPRFLRLLRPGTRIIMHTHDMGEWESDASENVKCECINTGKFECYRTARLYIVPENVHGSWSWNESGPITLNVEQRFQKLKGIIYGKEKGAKIQSINIRGDLFTMKLLLGDDAKTEAMYRGTVKELEITGTITIQSQYSIIRKNWFAKRDPKSWKSIDQ